MSRLHHMHGMRLHPLTNYLLLHLLSNPREHYLTSMFLIIQWICLGGVREVELRCNDWWLKWWAFKDFSTQSSTQRHVPVWRFWSWLPFVAVCCIGSELTSNSNSDLVCGFDSVIRARNKPTSLAGHMGLGWSSLSGRLLQHLDALFCCRHPPQFQPPSQRLRFHFHF